MYMYYSLLAVGGKHETDDDFLNTVEKLDLLTNTWTTLAPMHEDRAFHNSVLAIHAHISE